ncbi:hypothetical protein [Burkholderia ubonensis]|uniref:hypothetical protein n=1 Tax=Burkholderia ubonensis TaxID=101571 RepID=UPI000B2933E1|nr:hypothetical protein [Burkholderia ubonensis]
MLRDDGIRRALRAVARSDFCFGLQSIVADGKVKAVPIDHPIARTFDRYVITRAGRRTICCVKSSG